MGDDLGDRPENVRENRGRFAAALGFDPSAIVKLNQVHGDKILEVHGRPDHQLFGDALMTEDRGLLLAVRIADCVPILIYDPLNYVVAAAHSGWRGTVSGIAGKLINAMVKRYGTDPSSCLAAIGPSAGPCCYEVNGEVAQFFPEDYVIRSRGAKPRVDLWKANLDQLITFGMSVTSVELARICTICNGCLFFSYRRSNGTTGMMLGAIGLINGKGKS
jgi:YfiH family protein